MVLIRGGMEEISLDRAVALVKSGQAASEIPVRTVIRCDDFSFRVIGHNHDMCADSHDSPTMTVMGERIAGKHCFNSTKCRRGWIDSELRDWLNGEVFDSLPQAIRNAVRPARRRIHGHNGFKYESVDLLFVPTESEMFGSAIQSGYMDGERYEAFETSKDRKVLNSDGKRAWYWLASPQYGFPDYFCMCAADGYPGYSPAFIVEGAPICFIIA